MSHWMRLSDSNRIFIEGRSGGTGRRDGLKHHWDKTRVSSTPTFGTNHKTSRIRVYSF